MLLAAHHRNPLGVSSHHRWTQVSVRYVSSCLSFIPRCSLLPLMGRQTRCGCPTKMKSAGATKTTSYVTKSRTNNRRWVQQGVGEEDGPWRGDARSGRGGNRVRSHPPNHSAFSSRTPPSRPHHTTADRTHHPTARSNPFGVTVQRRAGQRSYALLFQVSPRCSSAKISPSQPARPFSSNARGLQRKLGLADRKS